MLFCLGTPPRNHEGIRMSDFDNVPLICDPVKTIPPEAGIAIKGRPFTHREILIVDTIRQAGGQRWEWPDAEFCAA